MCKAKKIVSKFNEATEDKKEAEINVNDIAKDILSMERLLRRTTLQLATAMERKEFNEEAITINNNTIKKLTPFMGEAKSIVKASERLKIEIAKVTKYEHIRSEFANLN